MEKHLNRKGISDVTIKPIVVLVRGKITDISGQPIAFITEAHNLVNHIFELNPIPNWDSELSNRILSTMGVKESDFLISQD